MAGILITIFNFCYSFAQTNEPIFENTNKSSFYAGLYLAPSYIGSPAYRYYYWGVPGPGGNVLIWGVQIGYNIKNRLAIHTGFEYSNEKVYSPENYPDNFPALSGTGNYYKAVYNIHYF